jgi:hypothetical protein
MSQRCNQTTNVKSGSLQVLENLERETRIELATNSLEDCGSVENKQHVRPRRCILNISTHRQFTLYLIYHPNGVNGVKPASAPFLFVF